MKNQRPALVAAYYRAKEVMLERQLERREQERQRRRSRGRGMGR